MDFDFVDDSRPRVQVQSQSGRVRMGQKTEEDDSSTTTSRSLGKVSAGVCASVGIGLVGLGLRFIAGPLQLLAIWFGLSLVVGAFAPPAVTGGDCRVGVGELVMPEFGDGDDNATTAVERIGGGKGGSYRSKENYAASRKAAAAAAAAAEVDVDGGRRSGLVPTGSEQNAGGRSRGITEGKDALPRGRNGAEAVGIVEEEDEEEEEGEDEEEKGKECRSEDVDALKKLIVKHPRGTLRRWEVIAEALGGRYSADNVVKMSKALGHKKAAGRGDQDAAYSRFLSQRKGSKGIAIASPLSQREGMDTSLNHEENINAPPPNVTTQSDGGGAPSAVAGSKGGWTDAEDKALLTALKTFPKDSLMRWDKVALAVPGRSKAQCFRRFSDLRKSFRSSTGGASSAID